MPQGTGKGTGGYGGPDFSRIDNQLRNIALSFGAIMQLQQQIGASVNAWRMLERELTLANAAAGGTRTEFSRMEVAARNFAQASTFSVSQVANSFYNLASAGFSVTETLQAATGVLLLAQSSLTDLGEASDVMSSSLQQFNLTATESYRVSNLFLASTNSSLSTVPKLAFALRQVGPIASNAGLSIEKTVAALDMLFDAGLRGEQAGTALRNALTRIMAPMGQGRLVLENLGIDVIDEATGRMRDFIDIMEDLSRMNLSQTSITQIFGVEAASGATALLRSLRDELGSTTNAYERHLQEISNTDWAYRQAAAMMGTLDGTLTVLGNRFNDFRVTIGQSMVPVLQWLADTLGNVITSFQNMTTEQKISYAHMALMLVQFALIGKGIGLFVGGIGNAAQGMRRYTTEVGRMRAANNGAIGGFGNMARAGQLAGRTLMGVAGTAMGLVGVGVAIWGIYEALNAVNEAAARTRQLNVGGAILDIAAQRRGLAGPEREQFTDTTDITREFSQEIQRINSLANVDPLTGSGSFQRFRMFNEAFGRGQAELRTLLDQINEYRTEGERVRAELNRAGELTVGMFETGAFQSPVPGVGRVLGSGRYGRNLQRFLVERVGREGGAGAAREELLKQLNEFEGLQSENAAEVRAAMLRVGERWRQTLEEVGGSDQATATARARLEQWFELAQGGSDEALVLIARQAREAARQSREQLRGELELSVGDSANAAREFGNQFAELVRTHTMLTPDQFRQLVADKVAQAQQITNTMREIQQQVQGIDQQIASELTNFVVEAGGLSQEQQTQLLAFLRTQQGQVILRQATSDITQGGMEMRDAAIRMAEALRRSRIGFQSELSNVIEVARAIPLVNQRELQRAIRENEIEWLQLERDIVRLVNPEGARELERRIAREVSGQEQQNLVAEVLEKFRGTGDETQAAVQMMIQAVGGEEQFTALVLPQIERAAAGDQNARRALIQELERYFVNRVRGVDTVIDWAASEYRNIQQRERRSLEQANREGEQDRKDRAKEYAEFLMNLMRLPTPEEIYIQLQRMRLEMQSSRDDYFNLVLEPIINEMDSLQLDLREQVAEAQRRQEDMFYSVFADEIVELVSNTAIRDAFSGRLLQRIREQGSADVFGREFTREMISTAEGINDFVAHVTEQFANVINATPDVIGGPARIQEFSRMLRATVEEQALMYEGIASELALAGDAYNRAMAEIREYQREFDAEALIRNFEQAMQLAAFTNDRQELELQLDVAIQARVARVILDFEETRRQVRERYERVLQNLGVNVTINPQTGRLERFTGPSVAQVVRGQGGPTPQETQQIVAATIARVETYRPSVARTGTLTGEYMERRVRRGRPGFHGGVDIAYPEGTPVTAPFSATVRRAGWRGGYGNAVELEFANGMRWMIGHLSNVVVEAGQQIAQGTLLGAIGSTGRSTGPHGHFEAWNAAGQRIDPRTLRGAQIATSQRTVIAEQQVNELVSERARLTEEEIAAREAAANRFLEQYNREMDAIDEIQRNQIAFLQESGNAAAIALGDIANARSEAFEQLFGRPAMARIEQLERQAYLIRQRAEAAGGDLATGAGTVGDIRAFGAASMAARLADLELERAERIYEIRQRGFILQEDTSELEAQINEQYDRRAELMRTNLDITRETMLMVAEHLQQLAHANGNDEGDILFGLRSAALSFAAEVPTVFETVRDTALVALRGVAEIGAGILTGSEQNIRQAVANMLRSMSMLLAKMVIMYGMLQLIRAIPGGNALLSALDFTAQLGGTVGKNAKGGVGNATYWIGDPGGLAPQYAFGGIAGTQVMTRGERRSGGVRQPNSAAMSIFGEGEHPEAYIPMIDRRSIPVRIDDNGDAYVPLPSGQRIPVNLRGAGIGVYALGGVSGGGTLRQTRYDRTRAFLADQVTQGDTMPGRNYTANVSNNFEINVNINGSATAEDADEIGRQVAKMVAAALDEREFESRRRFMLNRNTVQSGYGVQ